LADTPRAATTSPTPKDTELAAPSDVDNDSLWAVGWQWVVHAARLAASLMFACVFVAFIYKIVMRYAAGDAVAWADEISVVLFVWIIFWANAFLIEDRRQIRFDLLVRLLPPRWRRAAAIARLTVVGGLFLWALPGVLDYIAFLWRERTPVLSLRLDFVYACFGVFVVAVVLRSGIQLFHLVRPGWRDQV
jgi:TRAP-type C4-dicarboxylate transport system permease small subunit